MDFYCIKYTVHVVCVAGSRPFTDQLHVRCFFLNCGQQLKILLRSMKLEINCLDFTELSLLFKSWSEQHEAKPSFFKTRGRTL